MKNTYKLLLGASLIFSTTVHAYNGGQGFTGSEHKTIGDKVNIQFPHQLTSPHYMMRLDNGARISYGELLAMGDFFGVIGMPVSKGKTIEERVQRFINAFNVVAVDPALEGQVEGITAVIDQEYDLMQKAMKEGKSPSKYYKTISNEIDRQYNCITGGGCGVKTWWMKPGRHMKLEMTNYDHFGDTAWIAYEAGHLAAMSEAVEAKKSGRLDHLRRAYAMNAFASHFLSDRYASGHIRQPRVQLAENVTPTVVGNLLAKFMHDEEGEGINVHNANGQHWRAFGDSNYFEAYDSEHRKHITAALQKSADEVYQAYKYGRVVNDPAQKNMLPFADEDNTTCKNDTAQMFYLGKNKRTLYRRWHLRNMKECSWTKWWLGWVTLGKLAAIKGLPVHIQGQLAMSKYSKEAMKAGLIKDKNVLEYLKQKQLSR